jgi:hypothetical protein
MEKDMDLHVNRTEVERLLASVSENEHRRRWKTSLPKWMFALTLSGIVVSVFAPSDLYTAITTALAPVREKPTVDAVAAANVQEDLDYRIAQHAKSFAAWQAFLEAHPDGPHAHAAPTEIEPLLPTPPPQPVEVAQQSTPSPAPPTPPSAMVEKEPAPPPITASAPAAVTASAPLSPVRIEAANSGEPAHHGHRRAEYHARHGHIYVARRLQKYAIQWEGPREGYRMEYRAQVNQPNFIAALGAQLFHPHRQRRATG